MVDVAELHPRLLADSGEVMQTADYWLRWMNDQRFAWLIVVPRVAGLREWHHLPSLQQQQLLAMVSRCASCLEALTSADKINIGALGNLVPQLHVHIIARHHTDPCWPGPVWGCGEPQPWPDNSTPEWLPALRDTLCDNGSEHA